jgi:hypothetical protein
MDQISLREESERVTAGSADSSLPRNPESEATHSLPSAHPLCEEAKSALPDVAVTNGSSKSSNSRGPALESAQILPVQLSIKSL